MAISKSRSLIIGPAIVQGPAVGNTLQVNATASGETLLVFGSADGNASARFAGAGGRSGHILLRDGQGGARIWAIGAGISAADMFNLQDLSNGTVRLTVVGGASGGQFRIPASPISSTVTTIFTGVNFDAASDVTYTSNATLTNDAIIVTVNETGTYEIECFLAFFEATASTGGFQFDFGQGTATISAILFGTDAFGTSVLGNAGATSATTAQSFATIATSSSAPSWSLTKGKITFSGTGTFGLRTAQASSSANTTTRKALSYLKLTKTG